VAAEVQPASSGAAQRQKSLPNPACSASVLASIVVAKIAGTIQARW
jgi:hypothetical protein